MHLQKRANEVKKIIFLIPTFIPAGGAERVLLNLVNNMDYSKFDVTVFALFRENAMVEKLNKEVHFKSLLHRQFRGNSPLQSMIPAWLLYQWMIRDQYDIAVSFLEGPTAHILSGCPEGKTKKIAWIHTELKSDKAFAVGFHSKKQALSAYKKMDTIVCVADRAKNAFEKTADAALPPVRVLYNTNNTALIAEKAQEIVEDVSFDGKEVKVFTVARVIKLKGIDRLARVHKRLMDDGIQHHIYVLGVGAMREEIERYLKENHLENTFTFLGFRDNPYKYVAKADMYVCPSRVEGFSTAVTEALIVGTPVVCTDCSGAYEQLGKNNEYGIVVENSEDGIYEGMKKMLTDSQLRSHYAAKAKERGSFFSTEKSVAAVEKMLSEL